MMKDLKTFAFFFWIVYLASSVFGTEYVPVYMWETSRHTETIPALDRISEDSFKDLLLERLTKNPFVVIFAERNLSPEDFARHDSNGQTPFSGISQLKSSTKVTYWPFVHSAIRAVKQLDKRISEISAENLDGDLILPSDLSSDEILIVDLNDAKDDEDRLDMLKRHDEIITKVYKKVLEENDNVLAFYTAHHTSWVVSEDVGSNRRVRSLLATAADVADNNGLIYNTSDVLLYVDASAAYNNNGLVGDLSNYNATVDKTNNNSVTLKLTSAEKDLRAIKFIIQYSAGYWYLNGINVTEKENTEYSLKVKEVYAPVGFSYHCTAGLFYGSNSTQNLSLPRFQIQAYSNTQNRTQVGFGDAYDCVGFTTAPIWSGLFVTFILALIMTFGLTFMMDIKTMDRFDDPKGKTITVNVTD